MFMPTRLALMDSHYYWGIGVSFPICTCTLGMSAVLASPDSLGRKYAPLDIETPEKVRFGQIHALPGVNKDGTYAQDGK